MDTNRSSDGDDGSERAVEGFEGRAVGDDDGPANDLEKSKRRAKCIRRVHTRAVNRRADVDERRVVFDHHAAAVHARAHAAQRGEPREAPRRVRAEKHAPADGAERRKRRGLRVVETEQTRVVLDDDVAADVFQ